MFKLRPAESEGHSQGKGRRKSVEKKQEVYKQSDTQNGEEMGLEMWAPFQEEPLQDRQEGVWVW